ncbi:MAG: RNB domain-containing ribonuclease [Spirochaetales bacterium]|nr:RNB domain-containing ribonuclease [Spirochaetales bacterium]
MKASTQVYTGKVIMTGQEYYIKPFVFDREYTLKLIAYKESEIKENDIITFIPGDDKTAVYKNTVTHTDTALADLYAIIEKNKITIPYPEEVMNETEIIVNHPHIDDPGLTELRDKPFITIDNKDSRDLDQALYIEKKDSNFHIYYALADGAFYIRPGTSLFAEALKRGTSYYFPGFSVPMLPQELSEGIVSLNPDVDRRAFVFFMEMDSAGEIRDYRCFQARIHSRAKLSYDEVQYYYDQPEKSSLRETGFTPVLDLLKTVGEIRIQKAGRMNRVQFRREESMISCSEDGSSFLISLDIRNDCSRYNEQLSLMCNMVGAQFLVRDKHPEVQGIYRVHQGPEEEELAELSMTIDDILESHGISDPNWRWNKQEETLADYIDRLYTLRGNDRLIEALERQVLISMRRSMFSSDAGEHYALAVNPYSRFSSPMREIVGIFLHKEALEKLGVLTPNPVNQDKELREKVILAGNRSRNLQKIIEQQVIEYAAERLFSHELTLPEEKRTRYTATILGIKATRLYVRLDSPPIELKVYTKDMENHLHRPLDFYKNRLACKKTNTVLFKPGDKQILYVEAYRENRWRLVPDY